MKTWTNILILTFLFSWTITVAQESNISALRQFAENYRPITDSNLIIVHLPNIPDKIISSFSTLRQTNNKELEKYLTLIFIKLYRSHMECCHQSYDIRNSKNNKIDSIADPLIYEYNLITKRYEINTSIEFISSSIGYDWAKRNPALLNCKAIKIEYDIIKQIEINIEKGKYWKK